MKPFMPAIGVLVLSLLVGGANADLPNTAMHVITAGRSDIVVHVGDLIQLEHTYLLIQSPPRDAFASATDRSVGLVKTLRVINPKVLGAERATIAALYKAETPGRSFLSLEIVEKNGKRKTITCQVDVR
jgi:hypothetical protein